MDLVSLGNDLIAIGYFSSVVFGVSGIACTKWYREKEAIASSILAVIGSGMSIAGLGVNKIGVDNNIQEITGYVASLSDEELESLSEDLIETDISGADIEEELADRMDLLSENSEMFSLDEHRELLQESVVSYLRQLKYYDPEEYDKIIDIFSDGYDDGKFLEKISKEQVIKKMNL